MNFSSISANFDEENFARNFNDSMPYDIGEYVNKDDRFVLKYNPVEDDNYFLKKTNRRLLNNDFILECSEKQTSPPDYLSESDLLALMDSNGIGTDASMATHIETITNKRPYVEVTGGRKLIPTKVGINLIHAYGLVDNELCVPKMRQDMEKACTLIAKGQAKKAEVVRHVLSVFKNKFRFFSENTACMDALFCKEYTMLSAVGSLDVFAAPVNSSGKKGKGKKGKPAGPSHDEMLELKRLGMVKVCDKGRGKSKGPLVSNI